MPVPLFGHPAPIAAGPAFLALETGAPIYAASARRMGVGRYLARMVLVPAPPDGPRRERLAAYTRGDRQAFEAIVVDAPEQWWGAFHPIWPDLVAGTSADGGAATPRLPRDRRGAGPRAAPTSTSTRSRRTARRRSPRSSTRSAAAGTLDVVAIADHERIDAALAARHIALDRGLPVEIVVGEEITTRGGHLLGLFLERRVPPLKSLRWSIEAVHDQGGIAIPAHPLVPAPPVGAGLGVAALLSDDNPLVHPDAIETFNPTAIGRYGHARAVAFAPSTACPGSAAATPMRSRRSGPPGRASRAGPRTTCARAILAGETTHHGGVPRLRGAARGVRAAAPQARPRRPRRGRRPDPPRRQRPRPRLSRQHPPAAGVRPGRRGGPVKIGLVSPYVYPLPGGVTQHVHYLYENLRLRGHTSAS